jgi:RNA polymerase sigma factor (sigma-70 family)
MNICAFKILPRCFITFYVFTYHVSLIKILWQIFPPVPIYFAEMTDIDLLREYVTKRSEEAFSSLVRRHLNLVYSAALRQVRSPQLAEEVAQSVFTDLSRTAARLRPGTVLPAWLYLVTRRTAVDVIRGESRRHERERIAAEMTDMNSTPSEWTEIEPLLDEAMEALQEKDREALLLRYFANQSLRDVGAALGTSENAAQKRVGRAVEAMRAFFHRRGVTVGASGLVLLLSSRAVSAAPSTLLAPLAAKAFVGAGVSTVTAVGLTKVIAMTTLQKTVVGAALAVAIGFGLYEAHEASQLRAKVRSLQEQAAQPLPARSEPNPEELAAVQAPPQPAVVGQPNADKDWASRLLALNTNDWRPAFALGQELAALAPEEGWLILRQNWLSVTNVSARQQLLKAFDFAQHQRLPAVLELAYLDPSPEVQGWALNYLKEVALQDFSSNYSAGAEWLTARRDLTLSAAFADAVSQATMHLPTSDPSELEGRLKLLKDARSLFKTFPDAASSSGLKDMIAQLASGSDKIAEVALETANSLHLDDEWSRQIALPQLLSTNSWRIRENAAAILGVPGREWALDPLLNTLAAGVYSQQRSSIFQLAQAASAVGSAKSIPPMIALIEADNSYDTVYGIGYFGLGKLTGVTYDEKHDGAWWRQWWANNKQRFSPEAQALEVPRLEPVKRVGS